MSDLSLAAARLPGIERLLLEYVKIAPLIRQRILIPLTDEVFPVRASNHFVLSEAETTEVLSQLHHTRRDVVVYREDISVLGPLVREQIELTSELGNAIDMCFPNDIYVQVLKGLFLSAGKRFTSDEIREPFRAGILASMTGLDTTPLSVNDVVAIRSGSAFDDYRSLLKNVLCRLHDRNGDFSDDTKELAAAAQEELSECGERSKRYLARSGVLADLLKNPDRLMIGAATGSLGGALSSSPTLAVVYAALGGAAGPAYDIIRARLQRTPTRADRDSFRSHFLVLTAAE